MTDFGRSGQTFVPTSRSMQPKTGSSFTNLGSCQGFNLSYHNKETLLFAIDPYFMVI